MIVNGRHLIQGGQPVEQFESALRQIAAQYGIRSIPTLYMFKGGEVVDQMVGAVPKGKLSDWMKGAIA